MMVIILITVLMSGGVVAWLLTRWSVMLARWVSLSAVVICFLVVLNFWLTRLPSLDVIESTWVLKFQHTWIPALGISLSFALDGLSLLMLLLTFFLGTLAVLISWKEVQYRVGFFHFNLLWVLAGITGVFATMDLFLFYFFWEVMLIPMYFLIGIWGHENKVYAAVKFFIFTQASGLLMLLAILGLYFIHAEETGVYTFDYFQLLHTPLAPNVARWLLLGFIAAFAVKLPVVPFHTWLPDAHSQAPTAGSLLLAGLLLKTGAYGLLRFVIPLFPTAAHELAPVAMLLGVAGILYGAILAYAQTDLKRLVAYTSVSHMGFVLLGVFAFNELALQGVVMQMITHGISTGALFLLAGIIHERIHTRDMQEMGGFWSKAPYMGTIALIFVLASLGLPGLGNFIAEFLTLIGTWEASRVLTIFAAIGIVFATAYSLRIMRKVFFGQERQPVVRLNDLNIREKLMLLPMVILIIWLGLFPQTVLRTSKNVITQIITSEKRTISEINHKEDNVTTHHE